MAYIHSKDIVHGDLAARNVLIDELLAVKIFDFGLAKQLYNNALYRRRHLVPLPWRWMAPESLSTLEVSFASDIWSYGITLWEIFTLGKAPYASGMWNTQHETDLKDGLRLAQPPLASPKVFEQMRMCWSYRPEERPAFQTFKIYFSQQYSNLTYVDAVGPSSV